MDAAIGRYPVSVSIPVAWGEMDAFQHVNNVVYARWLETARMVYLERIGLVDRTRDEGVGPILAKTVIDYKRPLKYPDTIQVSATITRIGERSFTMAFRIRSDALGADVASGEQVMVVYDYRAGATARVDDRLRGAIAAVEAAGDMANRSRGVLDERTAKGGR
jgi:acyl-CoA thioester hydrolase